MSHRSAVQIAFGIFAFLVTIYVASPIQTTNDSRWSLHTAMSLIEGRGGDLSEYLPVLKKENFYAIEYLGGRPHTIFPIGVSLLAAPIVGLVALFDPSFKSRLREEFSFNLEKILASIFGAGAAAIFFWLMFGQFERLPIAFAATIIFSLCTSMWSTATRALWQHGPLVLMLVIAMLLLHRARKRPGLSQYVSLPLAMAYLIRPTASIPIVVITSYVLVYHRAWFVRYVSWAVLIAIPWIVFNVEIYGALLPPYYLASTFNGTPSLGVALAGNLISPSRGLFVYSPVLLFALSGFALSLRDKDQRPLHLAFGAIVIIMLIAISLHPAWWGGHSYGPRYMTDLVPFFVYFTAFNFDFPTSYSHTRRAAVLTCIGVLAVMSLVVHAQGALRSAPLVWNAVPDNIDQNPSRLWDWSDPQFLRGIELERWNHPLLRVLQAAHEISKIGHEIRLDLRYDGSGNFATDTNWSGPESWGRWTTGRHATLSLRLNEHSSLAFSAVVGGLVSARAPRQSISIEVNGCQVGSTEIQWGDGIPERTISGVVPANCLQPNGVLVIAIDTDRALRPKDIGLNSDQRQLGVGVTSIRIRGE